MKPTFLYLLLIGVMVMPAWANNADLSSVTQKNANLEGLEVEVGVDMSDNQADVITKALLNKDWKRLPVLLETYRHQPNFDLTLYEYAKGAMLRNQGDLRQAIKHYENITQDPLLLYPRFDLAVMYFENKQFRDAGRTFEQIRASVPDGMLGIIDQYLKVIDDNQKLNPNFSVNFEKTDNVNNASDLKVIQLGNARFERSEDSLPQPATGIRYDAGIDKQTNLIGNHSIYTFAGIEGVHYWDNPSYDEFGTRFDLGYRYADAKHRIASTVYNSHNWLDGEKYLRLYGISTSYQQRLNEDWQVLLGASFGHKRYENPSTAHRYDGRVQDVSLTALHQPSSSWSYQFGLESRLERLQDSSESSDKYGLRFGMGYYGKDIGLQATLRYGRRKFLTENFWYQQKRKDVDTQVLAIVWHNKIRYKGFVPRLNLKYQHIDSNLALYDRKNSAWFVTVEKMF